MLLKILIIALLMYFALRAVQSLTRAVRLDQSGTPPRMEPHAQARPPQGRPSQRDPYRSPPPPPARRPDEAEDIEDAKWEDL